ncbi:MAG: DNA translocase FtsK 4TM domain-containing protein [Pseudomonadota bacterium]
MASRAIAQKNSDWRAIMRQSLGRSLELMLSAALFGFVVFFALALFSYSLTDPSPSTAAGGSVSNWMGRPGAWIAERALSFFGPASALFLPFAFVTARQLWRNDEKRNGWRSLALMTAGTAFIAAAIGLTFPGTAGDLPAGWGGLSGLTANITGDAITSRLPEAAQPWLGIAATFLFGVVGAISVWRAIPVDRNLLRLPALTLPRLSLPWGSKEEDDDAENTRFIADEESDEAPVKAAKPRPSVKPDNRPPPEISEPSLPPRQAQLGPTSRQGDFFGDYDLPELDLLDQAERPEGPRLDKVALERNARLLESVLADFRVQGEIKAVRPGPVVTMYELEPAPGTKASRVIQLADDIARNMSAISARIAVIPGRNVIGIELPNKKRDMVVLHEMLASHHFAEHKGQLPIILGKNISGDPVIADLAPMPHLLVAGTTGSGKSVGLNCMILSLLYRLTPDQCRLIMIDPKMLELSSYDDIPHLLSPVVTEPAKAVRALKWAVEQMEERYRMMSSISVRNLANFNEKVKAAKAKGKPLGRRVQTGFDPESGQPLYEEEQLDFEPLPQIVVIVDELADLMMTAGKEVEFLIQRLAQKARAAGIHLIMATQRPSVDVITGVIKANLPTRISFHVTSKIDSRTILGEQGAEQLLGKGDMLYMPGGKGLTRVHGPFVSDDEVRRVADHWRAQGQPDYVQSVTEEPEDGGFALEGASLDDNPEAERYRKACQIVFESQKASVSWLQRQLRVGYNTAARLIEQMEEEGLVSPPNHVGRREVFRDRDGNPI